MIKQLIVAGASLDITSLASLNSGEEAGMTALMLAAKVVHTKLLILTKKLSSSEREAGFVPPPTTGGLSVPAPSSKIHEFSKLAGTFDPGARLTSGVPPPHPRSIGVKLPLKLHS